MAFFFQTPATTYSTPFNGIYDKTISNTTAETSLMPMGGGSGNPTLPANWLIPGRSVRLTLSGIYSTTTIVGNVTYRVYLGSTVIATGVIGTLLSLASNQEWGLNVSIACRASGATGSVVAGGTVWYQSALSTRMFQGISPLAAVTVDTTTTLVPDITLQWATAIGSNTMTTKIATMELLQP